MSEQEKKDLLVEEVITQLNEIIIKLTLRLATLERIVSESDLLGKERRAEIFKTVSDEMLVKMEEIAKTKVKAKE